MMVDDYFSFTVFTQGREFCVVTKYLQVTDDSEL